MGPISSHLSLLHLGKSLYATLSLPSASSSYDGLASTALVTSDRWQADTCTLYL